MILGFLLSSVLFPVSVISLFLCDVIGDLVTTNTTLAQFTNFIPLNDQEYISSCLYGNGNVI